MILIHTDHQNKHDYQISCLSDSNEEIVRISDASSFSIDFLLLNPINSL